MAPEVLTRSGYGRECDWWSFGCILFEMLVGYAPFYAESAQETADKVLRHTETLQFPQESSLSEEARALIQQLLTRREDRIGVEAIKAHPFFSGVDWEGLRDMTPPHTPTILSETDTQHFEGARHARNRRPNARVPCSCSDLSLARSRARFLPLVRQSLSPRSPVRMRGAR